ncbi:MAG: hypothetical protein KBS73_07620 [Bacteroidales bacterium]|nr:hypothetical protein [Candidatus Cacconaster equifaecalis]
MRSNNYQSAIHEAAYLFARYILFKNLNTIESVSIWRRKAHINFDADAQLKEFHKSRNRAYAVKDYCCDLAGEFADVFADEDYPKNWENVNEAKRHITEMLDLYTEREEVNSLADEIEELANNFVGENFNTIQCIADELAKMFSGTLYRKDIEKRLDWWLYECRNAIYIPKLN